MFKIPDLLLQYPYEFGKHTSDRFEIPTQRNISLLLGTMDARWHVQFTSGTCRQRPGSDGRAT
jgi:hypothetical protein